jgi:hypothetical protein
MSVPKTPGDVAAINQEITRFLDQRDGNGRAIGNAK